MYVPVMIYSYDGDFIGWTIKNDQVEKLQTTNMWTDEQLSEMADQIARLNNKTGILAYWPDTRDPEVQALINDPNWEPVADEPVEVVDEENSVFIWIRRPNLEEGDVGEMDEDASTLVYKYVMAPPPVLVQARWKKAQEIVARKRAGIEG
jgi:hypothetical protein